ACVGAALLSSPAHAGSHIIIQSADPAGAGLNDETSASPSGDNMAPTRGAQALAAFQYAASLWESALDSPVPIVVSAHFDSLSCTTGVVLLGKTDPFTLEKDVPGGAKDVVYPVALANRLAGRDLEPSDPDIDMHLNSAIGTAACPGTLDWYMGFDKQ